MPMETKSGLIRPTLGEHLNRGAAAISGETPEAKPLTRRSLVGALNYAMAQAVHGMYGWMEALALQAHPLTATGLFLVWWGIVFDVERLNASKSKGMVRFTGQEGASVLVDAKLSHASGVEFIVKTGGVITGGIFDAEVECLTTGVTGNLESLSSFTLISPLTSIDATAVAQAPGLTGGADQEIEGRPMKKEGWRGRILDKHQNPDHGGNPTDYERRAKDVAGVTRAWTSVGEQGAGSVTVRFVMDEVRKAEGGIPIGDGAPNYTGDLKDVYDHLMSKRRVVGRLFVAGPLDKPINVTISELDPATDEVKANIETELQAMFSRESQLGKTMESSWFTGAVSDAVGEISHKVDAPAADVDCLEYEIPVLGTVTYV